MLGDKRGASPIALEPAAHDAPTFHDAPPVVVRVFPEASCGRNDQPIHNIPYRVAQPLERGYKNYYSRIQGTISYA